MNTTTFGLTTVTQHDPDAVATARRELSARPRPDWGALDGELLGFHAGLKRLVKRERLTRTHARRLQESPWLYGAATRLYEGAAADDVTLLAAHDPAVLARAVELEAAERRSGGHRAEAIRWMGAELGYPPCCVEAFAGRVRHDDAAVLGRLLVPGRWNPWPAQTNPFVPGVSLVTHYPCRPDCEATRALARDLLAHLAAVAPEREAPTRRLLAAPLVVFDRFALVALEGGALHDDVVTYERAWLPFEGSPEALFAHTAAARLFLTRVAPLFAAANRLQVEPGLLRLTRDDRPLADLGHGDAAPPWLLLPTG